MKITQITASFGFTKNMGNYQTLRADASVVVDVEEGEISEEVFKKAFEMVKTQVAIQTGGQ